MVSFRDNASKYYEIKGDYTRHDNDFNFKEKIYAILLDIVRDKGFKYIPSFYMRGMNYYLYKNNFKDLTGAELGVGNGENTYVMLSTLNIKKYYAIDPYCCNSKGILGDFDNANNKRNAIRKLRKFGNKVELVEDFSFNAVKRFEDNSLDFVYIDGEHSYNGVKRDLDLFYPKVKNNGVIGGHDWNKIHFNINAAVKDFMKEHGIKNVFWGSYDDWFIIKEDTL